MGYMKCISDVVTEYAFQITRPSVIDDVAEILEEVEDKRRHHTSDEDNSAHGHGGSSANDQRSAAAADSCPDWSRRRQSSRSRCSDRPTWAMPTGKRQNKESEEI